MMHLVYCNNAGKRRKGIRQDFSRNKDNIYGVKQYAN